MRHSILLLTLLAGATAGAQSAPAAAGKTLSARQEIARLEKELAEQRALLLRLLQLQGECNQQMLRLAEGRTSTPPPVSVASVGMAPVLAPSPAPVAPAEPEKTEPAPAKRAPKTAEVTGKVHVTTPGPAWVFVEDVKGPLATGSFEIRQEDKQFSPRLAVIPRGTKLTFPNYDVLYHNVFSLSAGNTFDLGMVRAGDPVKARVMSTPGVVEIFCNLHSRMSSTVLVTPSQLVAKVAADGTFRLEGVPVGTHRISAWAGGQEVSTQTVEVGPAGAEAQFQLKPGGEAAHKNKLGQPYGSYGD